jgi:hypothetical protein
MELALIGGMGGALLNEFTGLGVDSGEGADILQGKKVQCEERGTRTSER